MGSPHAVDGAVVRGRAQPDEAFSVETEGGELVADALLGFGSRGPDDLSQPFERSPLVVAQRREVLVDGRGLGLDLGHRFQLQLGEPVDGSNRRERRNGLQCEDAKRRSWHVNDHPKLPPGDQLKVPPSGLLLPRLLVSSLEEPAAGPVEPVGGALSAPSKELWEKRLGLFP